ncbi:MAG: thymidine kinase [Patescibacteria group bacterium]|jgi:thymidine kinase
MIQRQLLIPGFFEIYTGCMKSGKTKALFDRLDGISYRNDAEFIIFKPETDTRDSVLKSRYGELKHKCHFIPQDEPEKMLMELTGGYKVIAIDEIMFFNKKIVEVIQILRNKGIMILASGLDTDFRGMPFGSMGDLLAVADHVSKSGGTCEYLDCNNIATLTQRLVNSAPAHYDAPVVSIEGDKDEYQCRCIKHHVIPGKPKFDFS